MNSLERAALLNPDVQSRLMEYQDLYYRFLRARRELPHCTAIVHEPDPLPFGFHRDGRIFAITAQWRKEFARHLL